MKRSFYVVTLIGLISANVLAGPPQFDLTWHTIDGGGGTSTGGSFDLSGTIGQPDAGPTMTGGSFALVGGFWPGIEGALPCPADIAPQPSGDGEVNVSDLLLVIAEWGNPGGPADINNDADVNVTDLLAVIAAWGPCP